MDIRRINLFLELDKYRSFCIECDLEAEKFNLEAEVQK